jgi:hypothetical protein
MNNDFDTARAAKAAEQAQRELHKCEDALTRARAALAEHSGSMEAAEVALARAIIGGDADQAEAAYGRMQARTRGLVRVQQDAAAARNDAHRAAVRAEHHHRACLAHEAQHRTAAAALALRDLRKEYGEKLRGLEDTHRAAQGAAVQFRHWSSAEVVRLRDEGWSLADLEALQQEAHAATNVPTMVMPR